jgi:tetratricopeptide (TPR) repeat protein
VAKLMTIQGPEQGLWGSRAEEQWREVSLRDPDHWGAAFALGQNYAYYPDVMGKTDEAIAHLERARAIQERAQQGQEHVRTYLSLARLYQRKGDLEGARSVLRAGLRYHPGEEELGAALDGLGG